MASGPCVTERRLVRPLGTRGNCQLADTPTVRPARPLDFVWRRLMRPDGPAHPLDWGWIWDHTRPDESIC